MPTRGQENISRDVTYPRLIVTDREKDERPNRISRRNVRRTKLLCSNQISLKQAAPSANESADGYVRRLELAS